MKQIITQHGWGLDKDIWINIKREFSNEDWIWKDNERGYFSYETNSHQWEELYEHEKIILCHSLGIHLIKKNLFKEATHIVLINSFDSFIPPNKKSTLTIKTLKKMEKKINPKLVRSMLEEFINRSFLPNSVDKEFISKYKKNLKEINISLLIEDFQKLYLVNSIKKIFPKNTKFLFFKSLNDFILPEDSIDNFINEISFSYQNKTKLIKLENQGHLFSEISISNQIKDWIIND